MSDTTDLPETSGESAPEVMPPFVPVEVPPLVINIPEPPAFFFGVPCVVPGMSMTPLAFTDRIADAEKVAVATAARNDSPTWLWMFQLGAAQEVRLDDPRTVGGVEAMVAAGILTQARAAEILSPKND